MRKSACSLIIAACLNAGLQAQTINQAHPQLCKPYGWGSYTTGAVMPLFLFMHELYPGQNR